MPSLPHITDPISVTPASPDGKCRGLRHCRSWSQLWQIGLLLAVVFAGATVARPQVEHEARAKCPICGEKFSYVIISDERPTGFRLDLKQFGNPNFPTPAAECPKCRFVVPEGKKGKKLSRDDIDSLRKLVESDRYLSSMEETTYFRLAVAMETLGRPAQDIGFTFLAASWQVDDDSIRCQHYLVRSLGWYDVFLNRHEGKPEARVRAMLLKAELLRRLARFDEASLYLNGLEYEPAIERVSDRLILRQQRDLVAAKDSEPHLAVVDDASVDLVGLRVTTPGATHLRPELSSGLCKLPAYPAGPYAARVSGVVTLQLSVTRSGYVVDWKVKSSTAREFTTSVLRSVPQWVFEPSRFDGAPSPVELECAIVFGLEG